VTIGQGIDQDTHEGEHVVQTRLLGIRERRESLIDNLKRSRTRVNRMLIPHFCSTTNWKIESRPGYVLFRGSNPSETSAARGEETGVEEGEGSEPANETNQPRGSRLWGGTGRWAWTSSGACRTSPAPRDPSVAESGEGRDAAAFRIRRAAKWLRGMVNGLVGLFRDES
jgi:hypothetical protein